ncbi:MAG TPA: dienelactone hydrolase family protein [Acidimicrobiia bacterium]|nr:dienelactone hydrolase family protein [Acidimicrobiia bacterium]
MSDIAVPFFCSLPAAPAPWPGVVVVMEGDGMKPQLLRVSQRLAAEGYAVIAPDLYWRFGGSNPEAGGNPFGQLRHQDGRADIVEVVQRLRALGAETVGITGFCMGGGYAYLAAVSGVDVDAAAPFYGGGIALHLGDPYCPLLCFFGGTDEWIPREDITAVEEQHPGQVVVYEDAGHGFMRDGSISYDEAAASDAWGRLLAFFGAHLTPVHG